MALSDSLVLYCKLDEASGNAIDSKGTNNLTDNNTVGSATGLIYPLSRDFEKDNSETLSHTDNSDLSVGDIDASWIAWVKPESLGLNVIASKFGSSEYSIHYNNSASAFRFEVYGSNGFANQTIVTASTFGAASTGNWYMVATVHDSVNNLVKISINAGAFDSLAHTTGIFDGTGDLVVGGDVFGNYFDGLIGGFGFWKRTLSSTELTDLYNGGSGRTYEYIAGGTGWGKLLDSHRNRLIVVN